jgi:prevent-host-death family protein
MKRDPAHMERLSRRGLTALHGAAHHEKRKVFMPNRTDLNLNVDLQRGVVPISKAASSLAALIKRASSTGQPVIVTQKGYPTGVLLPIGLFTALKDLADDQGELGAMPELKTIDEIVEALQAEAATPGFQGEPQQEDLSPAARRPAARRRKRADAEPAEVVA